MPSTTGFRRRFKGHSTLPYHSYPLDHEGLGYGMNPQFRYRT